MIEKLALILSLVSLGVAWKAMRDVRLQSLYSGFSQANQATLDHPELINQIHGLDLSDSTCREIAYLSILMDAFQHSSYKISKSTFLNKIVSVPENEYRWKIMKEIYYGEFDRDFTNYIDSMFKQQHENS